MSNPFADLPAYDEDDDNLLSVVIETPKGSRNKFKYDEKRGVFSLSGVLPAGAVFPFDFGYLPSTQGQDGDPLDILLLMDEPAFAGCLIPARLLGVIEAEQTERDGKTERNDRLVAVAAKSHTHRDVQEISDLNDALLDEVEHFFKSYNDAHGKKFKPTGRFGKDRANALVQEGIARAKDG